MIKQYDWIWITECQDHAICKETYPNAQFCNKRTGKCEHHKSEIRPPKIFDPNDQCKKQYGDIFVYDPISEACRIPYCSVENDFCPKPSECYRGMCTVFNKITAGPEKCDKASDCDGEQVTCLKVRLLKIPFY
jgi:hypothetical protein